MINFKPIFYLTAIPKIQEQRKNDNEKTKICGDFMRANTVGDSDIFSCFAYFILFNNACFRKKNNVYISVDNAFMAAAAFYWLYEIFN